MGTVYTQLSYQERRTIEDMLNAKISVREIAAEIGRHVSTVCRDIKRNGYTDKELPELNGYYGGVTERLVPLLQSSASRIVLMIGINNIQGGLDPETIHSDVETLGAELCRSGKQVTLLAVLPINPDLYSREIERRSHGVTIPSVQAVSELNIWIEAAAGRYENVTFLDLSDQFTEANGHLSPDWTIDGLHLSGRGLSRLADFL